MAQRERTLFETLSGGVRFVGDMALIVMPMGHGAIICFKDTYLNAKRWADGKPDTHILARNVELFCAQLEMYVSRLGSALPTKGHSFTLLKLAKAMRGAGMDIDEWGFPKDVFLEMLPEHLKIKPPAPAKKPDEPDQPAS
jgi:hypothetical protein